MPGRVICLHSAIGLTEGVEQFADLLRVEGCHVDVPDFYDGATFDTAADGAAHRDTIGYRELFRRVADLDIDDAALIGFSLGASFAQRLCRVGVRLVCLIGALDPHPADRIWCGVDVQLHHLAEDPWVDDEDIIDFRNAVGATGAMFDHYSTPGSGHLFTEPSQPGYDRDLTELTIDRIIAAL